jgi:hypothetical protein
MQKTKAKIIRLKQPDASSSPKSGANTPAQKKRNAKTAQRKNSGLTSSLWKVPNPQPAEPVEPEPVFSCYTLCGPDGKKRSGWALHVNGVLIGKAESKENLLEYYTRLAEPLSSNHWRDSLVRRRPRRDPIAQSPDEGHGTETAADPPAEKSDEKSGEDLRATAQC